MNPGRPRGPRSPGHQGGVAFPATDWTMVLSAREQALPALGELCQNYQQPIRAFFRQAGCPAADLEDMTQDFLRHLLRPDVLKTVDPALGRFRSFLLACLRHHWAGAQARANRWKSGGRAVHVPLEEGPVGVGGLIRDPGLRPDEAFDRAWVLALLTAAARRLVAETALPVQRALVQHLLPALYDRDGAESMAELASRLGMTPGAVRTALHRVRQRLRALILEELAATVGDRADLEAELRELRAILARS
ncbi:MAG: sigma-70 family RNA polymerase sigma factor [Verrucomicrobiales bacterium]|nr:sigma-70 family RNA polymerase sigma factor [Verrucomicrobiales bacterium]